MRPSVLLLESPLHTDDLKTLVPDGEGGRTFSVLVLPGGTGRLRYLLGDEHDTEPPAEGDPFAAGDVLDRSLELLREQDHQASGEVVLDDPIDALYEEVHQVDADALIAMTSPEHVERLSRSDWADRLRQRIDAPSVELFAHSDTEE
ncbi:hypothetical protein [Nocardiopsis alba]|uniref:hypothetical protein n=1 Tax=Nocardiopsis alba TaxID=53437 RepID=UPI0033F1C477